MRYQPRSPSLLPLLLSLIGVLSFRSATAEQRVAVAGKWMTPAEAAQYRHKAAAAVASPAWGTASTSLLSLGPCDAALRNAQQYSAINCDVLTPVLPGPSSATVGFPVHLPTGALITEVTVNYYDTDTAFNPSMGLWQTDATGNQGGNAIVNLSPSDFSGGANAQTFVVDPPYQVDNTNTLAVLAILDATNATEYQGVFGILVRYQLQVSPAPATATFNDVPTDHQFFRFIEALAASGITGGCGNGNFCPDNPVTRGQMATFLSIALGLHFPN
jgi:S-layer homology domain